LQPIHQRQIVRITTEQRLTEVDVGLNKTGKHEAAARINDDIVTRVWFRTHDRYPTVRHRHSPVHHLQLVIHGQDGGVSDEDRAHQGIIPSARGTQSSSGVFPINTNLSGTDEPERVEGQLVSVNYFALLGVRAQVGRLFLPSDPVDAQLAVPGVCHRSARLHPSAGCPVCGRRVGQLRTGPAGDSDQSD
jgi:hypothetical protein